MTMHGIVNCHILHSYSLEPTDLTCTIKDIFMYIFNRAYNYVRRPCVV